MKETGYTHWLQSCGSEGSNSSGFTARPAGMAGDDYRTYEARFWSSTEENDTIAKYIFLDCSNNMEFTHDRKGWGFSVRCVKD